MHGMIVEKKNKIKKILKVCYDYSIHFQHLKKHYK